MEYCRDRTIPLSSQTKLNIIHKMVCMINTKVTITLSLYYNYVIIGTIINGTNSHGNYKNDDEFVLVIILHITPIIGLIFCNTIGSLCNYPCRVFFSSPVNQQKINVVGDLKELSINSLCVQT